MRLRHTDLIQAALPVCLAALACLPAAAIEPPRLGRGQKLAPYVASPQPIAEKMLEMAKLKGSETLYDLGCGDGRILFAAAQKFRAHAVGIELSSALARRTQQMAESQGLQDAVRVIEGDMMNVDISQADVVSLYLLTDANEALRPKLERELRPGARVVSLEFKINGWKPARVEKVELHRHPYTIYVYQMPQH